jgi:hypothetical protein
MPLKGPQQQMFEWGEQAQGLVGFAIVLTPFEAGASYEHLL